MVALLRGLWNEFISHPAYGQDALGMVGISFEFLSQPANVDVYHLRLSNEFSTPNPGEEIFRRNDCFRLGGQRQQQAKLAGR